MDIEAIEPVTPKKRHDKADSSSDGSPSKRDGQKSEKKSDSEDPKPRIVLTFRSEKSGAKSSAMKIVSSEEKQEETEGGKLRRSTRSRARYEDDFEFKLSTRRDKSSHQTSENEDASDSSHTTPAKRSTRRRSRDSANVMASAIARKERAYDAATPQTRPSRRIKPTVKVLANEELKLESQNSTCTKDADKSLEEGVRTRRSNRSRGVDHEVIVTEKGGKEEAIDVDDENSPQVMKLKHLCELGLQAINTDADCKGEEAEADESLELEEDGEDEEIDDDTEVISKLLEADAKSIDDTSDVESAENTSDEDYDTGRPKRSTSAPRRRSSRKRRQRPSAGYEEIVGAYKPQHKRTRPAPVSSQEDAPSEPEPEEGSNPAAADDSSEAACPPEGSTIVAKCFCETLSNVYAAPSELTEPVFCQAIELVDGVRVGCSHPARREPPTPSGHLLPLLRAGPRTPFVLVCTLHAAQLIKHMCCPACGLFCTQGIFYQCSSGHLFHLECGLPLNGSQAKDRSGVGCPHCGVHSYRWLPANKDCSKVQLRMRCSNKRIFLPDQREQCTPAYLGFSTLDASKVDTGPLIPEDLLPSPPIDLKQLCERPVVPTELDADSTPVDRLCDAILAGEDAEKLIPKIMSAAVVNAPSPRAQGGTALHVASTRGHLTAVYLLHFAGGQLDALDGQGRTPLMTAVLALLDKSDSKTSKKASSKEETEESSQETDTDKGRDEDSPDPEEVVKVIRYLVAAGCDLNMPGPEGMTALHMAAQHGGAAVCRVLLQAGCDVDARDIGGWTPLVWAAENCHNEVVRELLLAGADPLAPDAEGNLAIHWVALAGGARALQLLLDAAPHAVRAVNRHTDTPLHVAARQGHYACVVILLARGARTDVENAAGELPVEVCTDKCQSAISLNMQMALRLRDGSTRQRLLCSDISRGREPYPLACVNEVDDTPLPDDFTYVTSHVMPRTVVVDYSTQSLQGCTCEAGDCSVGTCACVVLGIKRWWARDRLKPDFPYHDPPMLFECNLTCGCDAKRCKNTMITHLTQRGSLFIRACVFRCGGARGWGLRAQAAVQRGTPVAVYVGELLSVADADTRAMDQYMFALDVKADLLEQCSEKTQLCVDAGCWGGAARFINHSCRPNLAPVRVFNTTRDLRLPTVALFATRDIAYGDELTFDYGEKFWSVKSKWMKCECGTPACRYSELKSES